MAVNFKLSCWNIQGLASMCQSLTTVSDTISMFSDSDFIALVECWVSPDESKSGKYNSSFSGYITECMGRKGNYEWNRGGTAFLYKPKYKEAVTIIDKHDGDIIWVKLSAKVLGLLKDLYIGIVYIPPQNSKIWLKKQYDPFDILEKDILAYQIKGDVILCGDFNSRSAHLVDVIQSDNSSIHSPLPTFYNTFSMPSHRNNRDNTINTFGKELIQLCQNTDTCILNGRCVGDMFGNLTCYTYNGASTVDYIIVNARMYENVRSLRVMPLSYLSDHCLISLIICIDAVGPKYCDNLSTLPTHSKSNVTVKTNKTHTYKYIWKEASTHEFLNTLKYDETVKDTKEAFLMKTYNSSQSNINEATLHFTNILLLVSNKSLKLVRCKKKVKKKKKWFDSNCLQLKRNMKLAWLKHMASPYNTKLIHELHEKRKIYKKTRKYKENKFRENLLKTLNELQSKNPQQYWKLIKNLTEDSPNEAVENIPISTWQKHFTKQNLNTTMISTPFHKIIEESLKTCETACNNTQINRAISAQEFWIAITKLKNQKSNGPDLVLNEMLKNAAPILIDHFLKLFNLIFDSGCFPMEWTKSFLVPIHKKGDNTDVNNYRGIAIGSCLSKLFLTIINNRIVNHLEENNLLDDAQFGFRKGRSTVDNIYILNTLINKHKSLNRKLFVCFVDFSKAFDSVWRDGLFYKLLKHNINGPIYRLIKNMYQETSYIVKTQIGISDPIMSEIGVKQGCVCSPTLFNIFLNDLQHYLKDDESKPPILDEHCISHLLFADDLTLFSTSQKGLQKCLDNLKTFCENWKLKVNETKTKIIVFGTNYKSTLTKYNFTLGQNNIDITDSYNYLGVTITNLGNFKTAISNLKGKAMRSWYKLKQSLSTNNQLPINTLIKMYHAITEPICTYGSEVWGQKIIKHKYNDIFMHWDNSQCNKVTIKACKSMLEVPKRACNIASLAEVGIYPMSIEIMLKMTQYWMKLQTIDSNKLISYAFQEDKMLMQSHPKVSWAFSVQHILSKTLNISLTNDTPTPNTIASISTHLKEKFQILFLQCTEQFHKLKAYSEIKHNIKLSEYLLYVKNSKTRKALTNLRISTHPLEIERGRYTNIPPDKRHCTKCALNLTENERHFLVVCPFYNTLRLDVVNKIQSKGYNTNSINLYHTLLDPPNDLASDIAYFIYSCFQKKKYRL